MAKIFDWCLGGLDRCRFEAYTKLLRLRQGGQAGDIVQFDPLAQETHMDEPPEDDDSVKAQPLAGSDQRKLKCAFLDRLSEILSPAKSGYQVAAALMIEGLDGVEVTVARNCGIKENDKSFIKALEKILVRIAHHGDYVASGEEIETLWELLLTQYRPRIHQYVSDLRQTLYRNLGSRLDSYSNPPLMQDIRRLSSTITNDPQDLNGIVLQAYDLKKSHSLCDFESIHPAKPAIGRKIGQAVHCLGRPYVAFLTLRRAARRLNGFENLHIRWAELPSLSKKKTLARRKSAIPAWTVAQTFKFLGLKYTDEQARRLMCSEEDTARQSLTRTELVNRFNKLKPTSNEVHAEVQLMLDLARRGISFSTPFSYIGCSKLSCLLCAEFLASVGSFPTRGCHGKAYDLWTVPEQKGLEQASVDAICSAIKKLETRLEGILLDSLNPKRPEKESTIGGSSVATAIPLTNDQYLSNLIVNRLQNGRQHAMSAAVRKRPSSPEHKDTINEELHSTTPMEAGKAQDDLEVMKDFGFNRCKTRAEQSHLLGFPSYLEKIIDDARPYLREEDKDKSLLQLPPSPKKNCFVFVACALHNSTPNPGWDNLDIWYDFGFPVCLGSASYRGCLRDLRYAESQLGRLYNYLLAGDKSSRDYYRSLGIPYDGPKDPPTCPFDEFWRAYATLNLPAIFDKFGRGDEIDRGWPHLRTFLSCPQQERPLVWRLCHYIALDDVNAAASLPAVEAAAEAFGIGPHLNMRDQLQLYEFYGELLGVADPLRLQEAWETGTLLQFSKAHLGTRIDSRVCSLLVGLDISRRRAQDRVSQRKVTEAPHQAAPPAAETKKEKLEEEKEQEEEKETAKEEEEEVEEVEEEKDEDKVGEEDKGEEDKGEEETAKEVKEEVEGNKYEVKVGEEEKEEETAKEVKDEVEGKKGEDKVGEEEKEEEETAKEVKDEVEGKKGEDKVREEDDEEEETAKEVEEKVEGKKNEEKVGEENNEEETAKEVKEKVEGKKDEEKGGDEDMKEEKAGNLSLLEVVLRQLVALWLLLLSLTGCSRG
ncbi:hypothetical protein DL768_003782 [Monosporascus sp. mg162]|nr:hypothetical protein DL768_003782 [Monosporascus sp. mg162]